MLLEPPPLLQNFNAAVVREALLRGFRLGRPRTFKSNRAGMGSQIAHHWLDLLKVSLAVELRQLADVPHQRREIVDPSLPPWTADMSKELPLGNQMPPDGSSTYVTHWQIEWPSKQDHGELASSKNHPAGGHKVGDHVEDVPWQAQRFLADEHQRLQQHSSSSGSGSQPGESSLEDMTSAILDGVDAGHASSEKLRIWRRSPTTRTCQSEMVFAVSRARHPQLACRVRDSVLSFCEVETPLRFPRLPAGKKPCNFARKIVRYLSELSQQVVADEGRRWIHILELMDFVQQRWQSFYSTLTDTLEALALYCNPTGYVIRFKVLEVNGFLVSSECWLLLTQ